MPNYLLQVNYLGEGVRGLQKEGGTHRRLVAEKLIKSLGGKMEAFYFAFGETDVFVIAEMPDNASVAALGLALGASGAVTGKTTVLLTLAEMDEAAKKKPIYIAPGK
jgi:uncharacterized protein with GYD domain